MEGYWSAWQPAGDREFQEVVFEKKYRARGGGVARITGNRPHRLNAMTGTGFREIIHCIREANLDKSIGVIIITGAEGNFGAGGDMQWEAEGGVQEISEIPDFDGALKQSLKPTIALVQGYCIGGHNHLAYHCDFTIASEDAIFGQNGPRVASPAHGPMVADSALAIGMKRAKEMWMLCRRYTAQEALQMGLINCVVPAEQLDAEADRWCDELLDLAPTSLAIVKQSFEAVSAPLQSTRGTVLAMVAPDFHHRPEVKEAQQAFFEKRPPRFWPTAKEIGRR